MVDIERISIEYVRIDQAALWDRNPKQHDIGALVQSIEQYGFRDAPIYDATLEAIVAGNGRLTALRMMHKQGNGPPRGIALDEEGMWCAPIQFGIDAASRAQAEAFAIDHNNLTVAGGDGDITDLLKLYDREQYLDVVVSLAKAEMLPVSVSGDDVDLLLQQLPMRPNFDGLIEQFEQQNKGPQPKDQHWFYVEFYGQPDTFGQLLEMLGPHMAGRTTHEIRGGFFERMVREHVNGD